MTISDEGASLHEMAETKARNLAIRMVRSRMVAISRFDDFEACWFDLVSASYVGSRISLGQPFRGSRRSYDKVMTAREIGLLGMLFVDGKEVALPTAAAWEAAGLKLDKSQPHAPSNWECIHADWRRKNWTEIAQSPPPQADRSRVLAHDDDGRPITSNDIELESYRTPLDTESLCFLPPFDYPGGEHQWEIDQLIESVKIRRQTVKAA